MKYTSVKANSTPYHLYHEFVRQGLNDAGLWIDLEWFNSQHNRINLHWQMGLTPLESVNELSEWVRVERERKEKQYVGAINPYAGCIKKVKVVSTEHGTYGIVEFDKTKG